MKKNESRRSKPRKNGTARPDRDRTTVSMEASLLKAGQERAKQVRPFTFSDYVASLIEKDIRMEISA